MAYTRREFGKLALAGLPAAAVLARGESIFGALLQAKPNSRFNGVQIGTITYSYRAMADQSAEAVLKYVLDSGISGIELMGNSAEMYAGAPMPAGRGDGPGGAGRGRGRGREGAADAPPPQFTSSWNGTPCNAQPRGDAPPAARGGGAGGGRGRGEQTAEERAAQEEHAAKLKAWRTSASMDKFKALRKMYNDAGVNIYAWKQDVRGMTREEYEYIFAVAEALGCTHTTFELRTDPAELKLMGDLAMKHKVYAAYHTHLQGSMTAFDQAFAASKGNMANVDFGHWVAAGNIGGTPMDFLRRHHARISSFHLKDRTTPEHCSLNLPWGTGETPIKDILQLVQRNKWKFPGTIEMEYSVPEGSTPVAEVTKCVEFCRRALTT